MAAALGDARAALGSRPAREPAAAQADRADLRLEEAGGAAGPVKALRTVEAPAAGRDRRGGVQPGEDVADAPRGVRATEGPRCARRPRGRRGIRRKTGANRDDDGSRRGARPDSSAASEACGHPYLRVGRLSRETHTAVELGCPASATWCVATTRSTPDSPAHQRARRGTLIGMVFGTTGASARPRSREWTKEQAGFSRAAATRQAEVPLVGSPVDSLPAMRQAETTSRAMAQIVLWIHRFAQVWSYQSSPPTSAVSPHPYAMRGSKRARRNATLRARDERRCSSTQARVGSANSRTPPAMSIQMANLTDASGISVSLGAAEGDSPNRAGSQAINRRSWRSRLRTSDRWDSVKLLNSPLQIAPSNAKRAEIPTIQSGMQAPFVMH